MKKILRALCTILVLMMLPLAAFSAVAEDTPASYNFAEGQYIEAANSYVPPEGFFDVTFLNDGEWLTYADGNVKLGWNTDPYVALDEYDPVEIIMELDGIYVLEKIMIYPMKWSRGEGFPRDYELLGSMNGSDWFEVYAPQKDLSAVAADDVSVQPKEYTLDTPTQIRYFCLRITRHSPVVDKTGSHTTALGELELYGYRDTAAEAEEMTNAKAAAKTELETYRAGKDNKDYREAQVAELDAALTAGLEAVDGAATPQAIAIAVTAAKKALDAVKIDAQLTAEETTEAPTDEPTAEPTDEPTAEPTDEPTAEPTAEPTDEPTDESTDESTAAPTDEPTDAPAPETDAPATETDAPKSGCGAAVGMTAAVLLSAMAAAFALGRKSSKE